LCFNRKNIKEKIRAKKNETTDMCRAYISQAFKCRKINTDTHIHNITMK